MHLRGERNPAALAHLLPEQDLLRLSSASNLPNDISSGSAELIAHQFKEGQLDSIRLARLESTLVDISNWQGGMERIANTPLPNPYTYFPRIFSTLFCVIMPLSLVPSPGWFTPHRFHSGRLHAVGNGAHRHRSSNALWKQSTQHSHG